MTIIDNTRAILWFQTNGPGTAFQPYGVGEKAGGMSGKSIPGAGRTPVYGRTEFGVPVLVKLASEAPGDLPTATISIYERGQVDLLLDALNRNCPINIQNRINTCGSLINPSGWDVIDFWGDGQVTTYTPGDGPSIEYNGEQITNEATVSFSIVIRLVQTSLSALTTTETQNLLDIAGMSDEQCSGCGGTGYPGADKILYVAAAADTGVTANLLYSADGGATWAATSADPFAADEDISEVDVRFISPTQLRVVVATNTTDAGAPAKFAYADVDISTPGTTAWTSVSIAAGANGDTVEALEWLFFDRLYIASAGDIFISLNQGTLDPGAAYFTGSNAINGFAKAPDDSAVWAFGATNTILREVNQSGIFETRVGPSGGAAFTAVAVASDGTLYAGNGTSIFRSRDDARTTNWTELYDFGANKAVVKIECIGGSRALGGSSQLLRVYVDDTAGGVGAIYLSVDGGASFSAVSTLTNTGYNAAYISDVDNNKAIVVGDASGGTGVIHLLSPA